MNVLYKLTVFRTLNRQAEMFLRILINSKSDSAKMMSKKVPISLS